MPYKLNDKIVNLTPYAPIEGDYKIRLDANESYFQIESKKIKTAFTQSLNRYPDPFAKKLCKSFAMLYNVEEGYITAGNGSDELISLITGAFFSEGDRLLTLSNDFSMYKFYGNVFGIGVEVYPKKADFTISIDNVIDHINKERIQGIIFSNPCNPTSLCMSRNDVLKLATSVSALVVVDEAYMDFSDQSILDICHRFDNVIVLRTCSKAIGLAAIRLGFAVANERLTMALRAVKSPYNVNTITQSIGEIVLNDHAYIENCKADILKNKNYLYQSLLGLKNSVSDIIKVYESQTNFIFIEMTNAKEVYEQLLLQSIAVRLMGNHLRISTGNSKENELLIAALKTIFKGDNYASNNNDTKD